MSDAYVSLLRESFMQYVRGAISEREWLRRESQVVRKLVAASLSQSATSA